MPLENSSVQHSRNSSSNRQIPSAEFGRVCLGWSVFPVGGNREIGHVLWTAKAIAQDEAFSMGGAAERWSGVSATDASHEISEAALATA